MITSLGLHIQKINEEASLACREMTRSERADFFAECSSVRPKHLRIVERKFDRAGKSKRVWHVDEFHFSKLWSLLSGYAYTAVVNSLVRSNDLNGTHDSIEDLMADIREKVFYTLRFYGPTPNNLGFSRIASGLVMNVLVDSYVKRHNPVKVPGRTTKKPTLFWTSIPEDFDVADTGQFFGSDLYLDIPESCREESELILGNSPWTHIARICEPIAKEKRRTLSPKKSANWEKKHIQMLVVRLKKRLREGLVTVREEYKETVPAR